MLRFLAHGLGVALIFERVKIGVMHSLHIIVEYSLNRRNIPSKVHTSFLLTFKVLERKFANVSSQKYFLNVGNY